MQQRADAGTITSEGNPEGRLQSFQPFDRGMIWDWSSAWVSADAGCFSIGENYQQRFDSLREMMFSVLPHPPRLLSSSPLLEQNPLGCRSKPCWYYRQCVTLVVQGQNSSLPNIIWWRNTITNKQHSTINIGQNTSWISDMFAERAERFLRSRWCRTLARWRSRVMLISSRFSFAASSKLRACVAFDKEDSTWAGVLLWIFSSSLLDFFVDSLSSSIKAADWQREELSCNFWSKKERSVAHSPSSSVMVYVYFQEKPTESSLLILSFWKTFSTTQYWASSSGIQQRGRRSLQSCPFLPIGQTAGCIVTALQPFQKVIP